MSDSHAEKLRLHGLKATRQRLAVLEELHRMGGTADAQDLIERLRENHSIHKTTVYRNLEALGKIGLVRSVFDGRRAVRYELACEHGPSVHPHFSCRCCGRLICLDPIDLSSVWDLITQQHRFVAEGAEVRVVGLCDRCRDHG